MEFFIEYRIIILSENWVGIKILLYAERRVEIYYGSVVNFMSNRDAMSNIDTSIDVNQKIRLLFCVMSILMFAVTPFLSIA